MTDLPTGASVSAMTHRVRLSLSAVVLAMLVPLGGGPAAAAPECAPYCDATTTRIANRLHGHGHAGWLATVLEQYGYEGRRWAEITRIPGGHGKRYVGIIHVPVGNSAAVRRALGGFWFARKGTSFVLPLVTQTDTRGGTAKAYRTASKWAARRLGSGWRVVAPVTEPRQRPS